MESTAAASLPAAGGYTGGCHVVRVSPEVRIKPSRVCKQACSLDGDAIKPCLQAQHGTAGFSCESARFDAKPAAKTSSLYMLCGATPKVYPWSVLVLSRSQILMQFQPAR